MRRSRPLLIAEEQTWLESAPDLGPPPGIIEANASSDARSTLILPWWALPDAPVGVRTDPPVSLTPSPRPLPMGPPARTETLVRVVDTRPVSEAASVRSEPTRGWRNAWLALARWWRGAG